MVGREERLQVGCAACERRGVGAPGLRALAAAPEERVVGRRLGRSERRPGHHAADLVGGTAERHVLEVAADVVAGRNLDRGAGEIGGDDQRSRTAGSVSISSRDEAVEDACALRVADQDHAAAAVVVLEVVLPRREDVAVRKRAGVVDVRSRHRGAEARGS